MEAKSSNYAEYVLEREGHLCIEDDKGFITYKYHPDYVFIYDIFVREEYRKTGHITKLYNQVVEETKAQGIHKVLGSVDVTTNGATLSLFLMLRHGFKLLGTEGNMIYVSKEI